MNTESISDFGFPAAAGELLADWRAGPSSAPLVEPLLGGEDAPARGASFGMAIQDSGSKNKCSIRCVLYESSMTCADRRNASSTSPRLSFDLLSKFVPRLG